VALSPGDEQVKVWLEQTQAALAGGPAPTMRPAVLDNPPERPLRDRANGTPTGSNPAARPTRTGATPPPPPHGRASDRPPTSRPPSQASSPTFPRRCPRGQSRRSSAIAPEPPRR